MEMLQVNDTEHDRMKNMPQDVYDAQKRMRVKNPDWLAIRSIGGYLKRITGSVTGSLLGFNPYETQDHAVSELISSTFSGNIATQWGQNHEADALAKFVDWAKLHFNNPDVFVKEYGLIVDREKPWFGYSPDGEVHVPCEGQDDERYLLEIKCPFSKRNVVPAASENYANGEPLYGEHDWPDGSSGPVPVYYWFQMQLGFYTMKMKNGFFVIWNPHVTQVFHVQYSEEYVEQVMIPQATKVYWDMYLPRLRIHLATREATKGVSLEKCEKTTPSVHAPFTFDDDEAGVSACDACDDACDDACADACGDVSSCDASSPKRKKSRTKETTGRIEMRVAGISYRKEACQAALDDPKPKTVTLRPDPTNRYDSKAIKVIINDKYHIGFVPKLSQADVHSMLASESFKCELDDMGTFTHGYYARVVASC